MCASSWCHLPCLECLDPSEQSDLDDIEDVVDNELLSLWKPQSGEGEGTEVIEASGLSISYCIFQPLEGWQGDCG